MSKFTLHKRANNSFQLLFNNSPFVTKKNNIILLSDLRSKTNFLNTLKVEYLEKKSNCVQLQKTIVWLG